MIFLPDFFAEVRKLEQEMQDLIQRVQQGESDPGGVPYPPLVPPVDIIEQGDTLIILLDVPGISRDNLNIQYADGCLTITGRKPMPSAHREPVNFVCMERRFGTFRRRIYVRRPVAFEESSARLDNGILRIELKTRPERRGVPLSIPIATNSDDDANKEGDA